MAAESFQGAEHTRKKKEPKGLACTPPDREHRGDALHPKDNKSHGGFSAQDKDHVLRYLRGKQYRAPHLVSRTSYPLTVLMATLVMTKSRQLILIKCLLLGNKSPFSSVRQLVISDFMRLSFVQGPEPRSQATSCSYLFPFQR